MPIRQLVDAGAQSTVAGAITAVQTSVTLQSASGFPGILSGGQVSVTILDTGNPAFNAAAPLATPFEYQPVNTIAGNVLTFGTGGGGASRAAYAGTTPHAYFAGATVAAGMLAEDIIASAPWKFDEQSPSGVNSITIPASGTIPASYLGVNWRHIRIISQVRSAVNAQADSILMRFNGDFGGNYNYLNLFGNNNAPTSTATATGTQFTITRIPGATAAAGQGGMFEILIPNYAGTTFAKNFRSWGGDIEAAGAGNFWFIGYLGAWSTTAITSVTLFMTGNFVAGSLITTYLDP